MQKPQLSVEFQHPSINDSPHVMRTHSPNPADPNATLRKSRKPNFTEQELAKLVDLWTQYKTILCSNATDTVTRSTKARIWRKITEEINRQYPYVLRRVCDIRGKWEKLLCEARTCLKVRGLQPCRIEPAASTQRKRPSHILRRIMRINWPHEANLLEPEYESMPSLTHCNNNDEKKTQPLPQFSGVEPPSQFPKVQSPTQFPSVQSSTQFPSVQSSTQFPGVQSSTQFPGVQSSTQFPGVQSSTQFPGVQSSTQYPGVQSSTQFPGVQSSSQFPQHPPATSSFLGVTPIKAEPERMVVSCEAEKELPPMKAVLQVSPEPASTEDLSPIGFIEETDEDIRRDILRLQRTELRKKIEKLDLELFILRRNIANESVDYVNPERRFNN